MATEHIVALLIQERDRLNKAIEALTGNVGKRRGRPPKSAAKIDTATEIAPSEEAANVPASQPVRRVFSAATKRKMALAQKKRWAAKKASQ